MLFLMAMWARESCDFPDDQRLAAVCRVSTRLWKARIGPVIREFLKAENGVLISDRLRKEATYVERHCNLQSERKSANKNAEKTRKSLKNNKPAKTTDTSTDISTEEPRTQPRNYPTQQPNNPTYIGGGGYARAPTREAENPAKSNPDLRVEIVKTMDESTP